MSRIEYFKLEESSTNGNVKAKYNSNENYVILHQKEKYVVIYLEDLEDTIDILQSIKDQLEPVNNPAPDGCKEEK